MTEKEFTCLYNGPTLRNEFEVHRPGCRDIAKHLAHRAADWSIYGSDVIDAVQAEIDVYQHQDQGWDWEHFHIMPCAKGTS